MESKPKAYRSKRKDNNTEKWWYNSPKDGQRYEKVEIIERYEWFQLSSLSGREKRMGLGGTLLIYYG